MDFLPEEIHLIYLSQFLTFRDLGNLIQTSKSLKKIYDSTELWKKIYHRTCPDKWEITKLKTILPLIKMMIRYSIKIIVFLNLDCKSIIKSILTNF